MLGTVIANSSVGSIATSPHCARGAAACADKQGLVRTFAITILSIVSLYPFSVYIQNESESYSRTYIYQVLVPSRAHLLLAVQMADNQHAPGEDRQGGDSGRQGSVRVEKDQEGRLLQPKKPRLFMAGHGQPWRAMVKSWNQEQ